MNKKIVAFLFFINMHAIAQEIKKEKREFYFSWGYNESSYSRSNIHIKQKSLGNDYTLISASAVDKTGFDKITTNELTVPQYNVRIAWFNKTNKSMGYELYFDHVKYVVKKNELVEFRGLFNNKKESKFIIINDTNFAYQLNNGANFLGFSLVKRFKSFESKNKIFKWSNLFKIGAGPNYPHVENTILSKPNKPHFQFSGYNVGTEVTNRFTFYNFIYLELAYKINVAHYWGLRIYEGTASQAFLSYQFIGNMGVVWKI